MKDYKLSFNKRLNKKVRREEKRKMQYYFINNETLQKL
jgi:hypothetical protein